MPDLDWFDSDYDDNDDYGDNDDNQEEQEVEEDVMHIRLHGGHCCGIKHIHNMHTSPNGIHVAVPARTEEDTSFGRHGCSGVNDAHPEMYPEDFFNEAAPRESGSERLDRLVAFIKKHRSNGIIEIVLTLGQCAWFPVLEEKGFKEVTRAKNSNTSNTLVVFHLAH